VPEHLARSGGEATRTPYPVEWLSDNGPPYTALETRDFGKQLGLLVCTTPAYSAESNGMAESFVKAFKRAYGENSTKRSALYIIMATFQSVTEYS
jgi:putative transposase